MAINIEIFATTHVGQIRDHNEDDFIVCTNLSELDAWKQDINFSTNVTAIDESGILLTVADGLGGVNAGEVASEIAIQSVKQYFSNEKLSFKKSAIQSNLVDAIKLANQAIINGGEQNRENQGMGTTLIIGWLLQTQLYIAWVGDSRAYLYRKGEGLRQISKDHSLVQELIDKGEITEEQAFYHPNNNIITQSLGDARQPIYPGFQIEQIQVGDYILLCSDGLNGMLTDEEITNLIEKNYDNPAQCGKYLVDAANSAGGTDNITVALGFVQDIDSNLIGVNQEKGSIPLWKMGLITALFLALALVILAIVFPEYLGFNNSTDESTSNNRIELPFQKDNLDKLSEEGGQESKQDHTDSVAPPKIRKPNSPTNQVSIVTKPNVEPKKRVDKKNKPLANTEETVTKSTSERGLPMDITPPAATPTKSLPNTPLSIKEVFEKFRKVMRLTENNSPNFLRKKVEKLIKHKQYNQECCSDIRDLRGKMYQLKNKKETGYKSYVNQLEYIQSESLLDSLINTKCNKKGQVFLVWTDTEKLVTIKDLKYNKEGNLILQLEFQIDKIGIEKPKEQESSYDRKKRSKLIKERIENKTKMVRATKVIVLSPHYTGENEQLDLYPKGETILLNYLIKNCSLKKNNHSLEKLKIQVKDRNEDYATLTALYF